MSSKTRLLALAIIASILLVSIAPSGAVGSSISLDDELFLTASFEALHRHAVQQNDGTTYLSTGDIDAEWLRDASAVANAYVGQAHGDPKIARTLRGVIAREAQYVLVDPYANAFSADARVVERKFELDSLLYPVWLAYRFWRQTGDASILDRREHAAFDQILRVMRTEQHHSQRSRYHHPQLANNGRGNDVAFTGMVWTGFRPSDDPVRYNYNIPVNMMAVVAMRELSTIERNVYHDRRQAANAWGLSVEIERGIEQYGPVNLSGFGKIYAYEVDGRGHANLMDDANVPSLLSIPYLGYLPASDPMYQRTRSFALSGRNPYFYSGKYAAGIGSPHTAPGYVWPMALVVQALTSTDESEVQRVLGYLGSSDLGDHRLHESFDANNPKAFTRADFAWPNALYAELITARQAKGQGLPENLTAFATVFGKPL